MFKITKRFRLSLSKTVSGNCHMPGRIRNLRAAKTDDQQRGMVMVVGGVGDPVVLTRRLRTYQREGQAGNLHINK